MVAHHRRARCFDGLLRFSGAFRALKRLWARGSLEEVLWGFKHFGAEGSEADCLF